MQQLARRRTDLFERDGAKVVGQPAVVVQPEAKLLFGLQEGGNASVRFDRLTFQSGPRARPELLIGIQMSIGAPTKLPLNAGLATPTMA